MGPTIFNVAFSGLYSAGVATFLQATALDQKVFDFAVPHLKQAFAFGVTYSFIHQALDLGLRTITHTSFTTQSVMYFGTYTQMNSNYPTAYVIANEIAKVIAAFSAVYALRQMNYSISYRFAAVCMIPYVIAGINKMNE